ncbi:DUF3515 family protein [Pseudactinotalea sp. HY158]|uniref:DUF3515 family protein n=1 Tax=unclassified Pseudactinotalea TaxID=2649176 RepID=UPI00128DDEFD|nr:DUF3515 family protein [Pseudactinotalea sp. HY158]
MRAGPATAGPAIVVAGVLALSACASPVPLDPAPTASDPACAEVLMALPDEVAGAQSRSTTSQSSRAWGDPPITMRCGVTPPGPTTDRCLPITSGDVTVDWIMTEIGDESVAENSWQFTTFGREPAIQVVVPVNYAGEDVSGVLGVFGGAIGQLPVSRACL